MAESTSSTAERDGHIDYLELPAADFDAVEHFYTEVFGWRFTDYGAEYRAFATGRLDGGFYRSEARSTQSIGATLIVFYASDLDAIEARISRSGGRIVKPTFSFPGGRRFHFTDPHGNELAVWTDREPG